MSAWWQGLGVLGVTSEAALLAAGKSCAGSFSFLCPHGDNRGLKRDLGSLHARYSFLGDLR